jgi:AraC-like DNA-binding protein
MGVTDRVPAAPLDSYVARLRSWEGTIPYPQMIVFPVPTLQLLVNVGDAYHMYRADGAGSRTTCGASYVMGLWDAARIMDRPVDAQLVGATFHPSGAYPFLQLPLDELRNQTVTLDALWGRAAAEELCERVADAPTPTARVALLERQLLERLASWEAASRAPPLAQVRYATEMIARERGALSIRALSAQLGLSHKHLISQFKALVGMTPKALARLYRLRHVLACLHPACDSPREPIRDIPQPASWATWAQVAQHAGYYDEAHFNRDFAAFTGHTPTECLQLLRRFHAEHPDAAYALAPRFLPIG